VTRSFWVTTPFWIGYLLPPVIVVCVFNRGWFVFLPLILVFVLLPVFDAWSGVATLSREAPDLGFNRWFRVVTWCWPPVQIALITWLVHNVPLMHLSAHEIVLATLSVGATTGVIGMTYAHELIHRRYGYERTMGNILLASVTYPHFSIEHVKGHHRNVATPRDPATARLGESIYRFLPRTIVGSLADAWDIERKRLAELKRGTWSTQNLMLRYALLELVIYGAIGALLGRIGVAMFAGQSAVAILILEIINYIEHYGLLRNKDPKRPSVYEAVGPEISWDTPSRLSNWLLINLPRHSDHHVSVAKRYQSLELLTHAPHLPGGYGAMFLLALVPPLWFHVMNPRAEAARKHTPI
jgi:alkane 1-monooxygenase